MAVWVLVIGFSRWFDIMTLVVIGGFWKVPKSVSVYCFEMGSSSGILEKKPSESGFESYIISVAVSGCSSFIGSFTLVLLWGSMSGNCWMSFTVTLLLGQPSTSRESDSRWLPVSAASSRRCPWSSWWP